ncbi:MAG: CbiX/SirB N-terminal domain-containing protein [Proteobacteria bacterium]|nr:CbiX/SirB N-terminal domain-containing protein [Pseudomonadota bacterium]
MKGLLLLAHGARDAAWAEPLRDTARQLAARQPAAQVRLAFLDLQPPSLAEAGAELAALGCTEVHVLPLFLGGGGHVRQDVPPAVAALRAAHPAVTWRLHPAAGAAPTLITALADWAEAASQAPAP